MKVKKKKREVRGNRKASYPTKTFLISFNNNNNNNSNNNNNNDDYYNVDANLDYDNDDDDDDDDADDDDNDYDNDLRGKIILFTYKGLVVTETKT